MENFKCRPTGRPTLLSSEPSAKNCSVPTQSKTRYFLWPGYEHTTIYSPHVSHISPWRCIDCSLSHTPPLWQRRELHKHFSWPDVMISAAPLSFFLHIYVPRQPVMLSRIMWPERDGGCFQMFGSAGFIHGYMPFGLSAFKRFVASFVCVLSLTWGLNVRSEELESQPDSHSIFYGVSVCCSAECDCLNL